MNSPHFVQPEPSSHQIPLFGNTGRYDQTTTDDPTDAAAIRNESDDPNARYPRRVYPLDARLLSEEQIAVAFAMTSRRPEPFDEIARQVSEEKAADFHERWVLGYGHNSVAEHAVLHLAAENISRLACDGLEDNRLASYTEKSSRYQVIAADCFHVPWELNDHPALREEYADTCQFLFGKYQQLLDRCQDHLRRVEPQSPGEKDATYRLQIRRKATDACRSVLPASTLTNVGVTANARTLEHAISKLMSSELKEEHRLGEEIREQGRAVTPTLIKYADFVEYFAGLPNIRNNLAESVLPGTEATPLPVAEVRLVHYDPQAEEKLAASFLYGATGMDYSQAWSKAQAMGAEERQRVFDAFLSGLGPHDAPPRELETVDYTFEIMLDYGAYREFRRHRMQTYLPQPLAVTHGIRIPSLISDAGLEPLFSEATDAAARTFHKIAEEISPAVAQYVVTHAHNRRLISKMNLRECYHLFKLRTSEMAHESIREPMKEALRKASEVHPLLFSYLKRRD